jgi:L-iditol 2-dehydrogenase
MKHLICPRTSQVHITDTPAPTITDGEILVRMTACGICGTDLMKVYDPTVSKPVQLGHEIVGVMAETRSPRFNVGQRVAVAHHAPDYASHYTRRGSATQDPVFKSSNVVPGGFAEVIRVPADLVPNTVFAVPDSMPDLRAVFMEPLACCLRALERVPVQAGDTVMVVGVGAIGLLFVPLLRDLGAHVVASDVRPDRVDLAARWGAVPGGVHVASEGRGADVVILTVVTGTTLELAFKSVRDGGTIIPFGVKPGMIPEIDLWQMYRREISLVTSYSATPEGLSAAMALLARPGFELERTISHQFALEDASMGFDLLHHAKASKVVVTCAPPILMPTRHSL